MNEFNLVIWEEKIDWENPIIFQDIQPYLEDLTFPIEVNSDTYNDSMEILNRFFSDDRYDNFNDIKRLENFLISKSKNFLIIEGEVGIGKTWFIRKKLNDSLTLSNQVNYYTGVIDLLYTNIYKVESTIYDQLGPILDKYMYKFFGGSENALLKYAGFKYLLRRGIKKEKIDVKQLKNAIQARVNKWIDLENIEYARLLLRVLEFLNGPVLIIALDNIDNISEKDQEKIISIVKRTLRNKVIKIIVPFRRTSVLLKNRFCGLNEVIFDEMKLSPLNLKSMLEIRFFKGYHNEDLSKIPRIYDRKFNRNYYFPELFKYLYNSESGELLINIAGDNCRVSLNFTRRLLLAAHLKGLHNINKTEYVIASLMLSNDSVFDEGAPILNLFDNHERGESGNTLIRFRILEYFYTKDKANPNHKDFKNYFLRLGFENERVRKVLVRFLMSYIITSDNSLKPLDLEKIDEADIGYLTITKFGKSYFDILLKSMWYYISLKRGMLKTIDKRYVSYDEIKKWNYISHSSFINFLKFHEINEISKIKRYNIEKGNTIKNVHLKSPSVLFERVIKGEKHG